MTKQEILKNEIEALFKLEESAWREFHQRRSYEWKINFGLWAGLGTVSGFVIKENVELTPWIWVGIVFLFTAYIWWHVGLFTSNKMDQAKRNYYLQVAREKLKVTLPDDLSKRPSTSGNTFYGNWSHGPQIAITLIILGFAGYVLTRGPHSPDRTKTIQLESDTLKVQLVKPDSIGR